MKLFHYTTVKGYEGIQREGAIRPSHCGRYGSGVYLTDLNPEEHGKELIAAALYKGGASSKLNRLDHHVQLDIPEHEVEMKRENVYLYQYGRPLVLAAYEVMSKGDNDYWQLPLAVAGSGLVLATVGVNVAQALFRNATEGRQNRSQALYETLVQLLMNNDLMELFLVQQSDDGGSVRVCCKQCSKPVSEEYSGGFIFGSSIDEKALLRTLKVHRQSHQGLFALVLSVLNAVIEFVVAIVVILTQQLKWW